MSKLSVLFLLVLFFAGALVSGCAVGADAQVGNDGSIALNLAVDISPVFQAYLKDLAGTEVDAKGGFFDIERIRGRLTGIDGLAVQEITKASASQLLVKVKVANPAKAFASGDGKAFKDLFQLGKTASDRNLTVRLDRQTVKAIMGMVTSEAGEEAEYLLPNKDDITPAEYRANLDWALEDYGTKAQRAAMFDAAWLKLAVQLPGPVKSATGFAIKDKARGLVELKLSLIDLLVIREAKTFVAVY